MKNWDIATVMGAVLLCMIVAVFTTGCAKVEAVEPETIEANDLPAPATAPMDESIRYEQLASIAQARAEAAQMAAEAASWEETYWEPTYYETSYYEPYTPPYDTSDGLTAKEFQWMGVVEDGEHFYTWYSERVLPGGGLTELNANGRHSEDGFVKDGDGFIAVASCDYEKGTVIETPFGAAKVYDTGYLAPGQIDVYTSF